MTKPRNRVGAIISSNLITKQVIFAGYGEYVGDEIPPEGVTIMGIDLHELKKSNPRINLDTGKTIWGCQCWWGSEAKIKATIERYVSDGYKIIQCEV